MRVCPISVVKTGALNDVGKRRVVLRTKEEPQKTNEVSFKGAGGALGSLFGTAAGIGIGVVLTAASGGLLAPLLGGIAGCAVGGIGGDMIEASKKGYSDDDDIDDDVHDIY